MTNNENDELKTSRPTEEEYERAREAMRMVSEEISWIKGRIIELSGEMGSFYNALQNYKKAFEYNQEIVLRYDLYKDLDEELGERLNEVASSSDGM